MLKAVTKVAQMMMCYSRSPLWWYTIVLYEVQSRI